MISIIGLGLIKSSILVMYKNIFDVRKFRMVVYIVLAYVVGWTISFSFSHLFTCYPITVFIEPYYGNSCVQTVPMFLALLVSRSTQGAQSTFGRTREHTLTNSKVHWRSCRFCHPCAPDTHGVECQTGHEEEAGCYWYAHAGRSVSSNVESFL